MFLNDDVVTCLILQIAKQLAEHYQYAFKDKKTTWFTVTLPILPNDYNDLVLEGDLTNQIQTDFITSEVLSSIPAGDITS